MYTYNLLLPRPVPKHGPICTEHPPVPIGHEHACLGAPQQVAHLPQRHDLLGRLHVLPRARQLKAVVQVLVHAPADPLLADDLSKTRQYSAVQVSKQGLLSTRPITDQFKQWEWRAAPHDQSQSMHACPASMSTP